MDLEIGYKGSNTLATMNPADIIVSKKAVNGELIEIEAECKTKSPEIHYTNGNHIDQESGETAVHNGQNGLTNGHTFSATSPLKRIRCYCGYQTDFLSGMRAHVAFKHLQRPLVLCPHCSHYSKYSVLDMKKHISSQHPWSKLDPVDKRDEASRELEELLKKCTEYHDHDGYVDNGVGNGDGGWGDDDMSSEGGSSPLKSPTAATTNGLEASQISPSHPITSRSSRKRKHAATVCVNDASNECACALCGVRVLGMKIDSYNRLIMHENSLVCCPLCPMPAKASPLKQLEPLHLPTVPPNNAPLLPSTIVEEGHKEIQMLSKLALPPSPPPIVMPPPLLSPPVSNPMVAAMQNPDERSPSPYDTESLSDHQPEEPMPEPRYVTCFVCSESVRHEASHQHAIRHLGRNLIRCPLCPYTLRTSVTSMRAHIVTEHPGCDAQPLNDRTEALEEIREMKRICFDYEDYSKPVDFSLRKLTPRMRSANSTRDPAQSRAATSCFAVETCCLCLQEVRIPEAAHQHAIRHLGKNLIRCPHCNYSLRTSVLLMKSHIATDHPDLPRLAPINDRPQYIDQIRELKRRCFPNRYQGRSRNAFGGAGKT